MQPDASPKTRHFWRGKSVFLTGHTGFKGSWLSLWLTELGANVTGYSLKPPSEPNLFTVAKIESAVRSVSGNVCDLGALTQAMKTAKPDIVIHMAAQSLVRYSYDHPVETYATNVMGSVHVLEAVRMLEGVQATLIVTSDKCYENREQIWAYRENDPMGGHDPYSNSKGCAELVTHAYGQSYFTSAKHGALASSRAGNVIGGGDWALDRLVPDIVRALAEGKPPVLRRPRSVRPWQHVLEPLSGYLSALEHIASARAKTPESWNFAPGEDSHVDVETMARGLCAAWDKGLQPIIREEPGAVHEAHLLALDSTKARLELGWHPRWRLKTALARTAEWYKAYHAGENMREVSLAQIRDYDSPSSSHQESKSHVAA